MISENSSDIESLNSDPVTSRWRIDLDWYQRHNRSFVSMALGYLCPKCSGKLKGKNISVTGLLSKLKECRAKSKDFITAGLPITESIYRLFLANGNQPLNLEEVGERLSRVESGDTYRITPTPEILKSLLESDQYYGFGQTE